MPTASPAIDTARLRDLIEQEMPELIAIRHDLHAHPELGYQEARTSGVVACELEAAGVEFRSGLAGGTGVLGHLSGGGAGESDRATALRADMDALPIHEETGASYASTTPGKMHACGHDGHTTMLIGAARVLAKLAEETALPRPVTFIFQPAEEGGAGGKRMVEDGCLTGALLGPPADSIFGLHGWPQMPLGVVATRPGPMLAAADKFDLIVRGRGTHAAYPHYGRDPILAGAAIVQALQQIASRNVGPLDSIVVSVTQFHAGSAHNIIPETITIQGTVRTLHAEIQTLAQQRLHNIASSIAAAHQCDVELDYHVGYPVTSNDPDAVDTFFRIAHEALPHDHVQHMPQPVMGGEDFAYYGRQVPACFFALGLIPPGQTSMPVLHHPTFDFNDHAMPLGIELFCRLAMRE